MGDVWPFDSILKYWRDGVKTDEVQVSDLHSSSLAFGLDVPRKVGVNMRHDTILLSTSVAGLFDSSHEKESFSVSSID